VSGARFLTTQRRVLLPLILPALTRASSCCSSSGCASSRCRWCSTARRTWCCRCCCGSCSRTDSRRPAAALGTIMIAVVLPVIFVTRRILRLRSVVE
jgi:hypothetical protein